MTSRRSSLSSTSPPSRQSPKKTRCAIYTRVSTDQGLDQEFNSLDAQREAAEAYIKSQAHDGWTCLKQVYDDGGFSGGSMERPALQNLLDDVQQRKLDVIVVYKVDRLTRSLADFAKLVELFDAHEVSFVSVTQSFNTTSSMGRLTLNVLLSFAQFEREVTGERIRDKFAASKKKGMFMGGVIPYGYRLEKRKLLIDPPEAEKVRLIFSLYLELKSLPKLAMALAEQGIVSRQRSYGAGKTIGGQPFRTGALSHLLANRIYIGDVRHHTQNYPGEHQAILDTSIFEAVQIELAARLNRENRRPYKSKAPLRGLLFDSNGIRMIPSHANKSGLRYGYYQSWVLNQGQKEKAGVVARVPAQEIEDAVRAAILESTRAINHETPPEPADDTWTKCIERIDVYADALTITLNPGASLPETAQDESNIPTTTLSIPWSKPPMRRRRALTVPDDSSLQHRPIRSEARSRLLKAIAQARVWQDRLVNDRDADISTIAKENGLSDKTIRATLSLALLAPDIVGAAIDARLHRGLTVTQMTGLSADWQQQRQGLGLI
jgi:site-specific DNA recombinase